MAARDFSDVMKEQLATRQTGWERFVSEITNEGKRLGTQGAMEMAQALFNGAAFTPYGPGQYTPTPEMDKATPEHGGHAATPQPEHEQERGGRGM